MPDLTDREKNLLKLLVKKMFFECPQCIMDDGVEVNHDSHKLDIAMSLHFMGLDLGYLDMTLIGTNINYEFIDYLQVTVDELVSEGFLTPLAQPCGGCGGLMYVRTDTMKWPASVLTDESGKMCRFG